MYGQHIVAIFPTFETAAAAKTRLTQSGFDNASIRLSADGAAPTGESASPTEHQGFFQWLFGSDVPEKERDWYRSNLRQGRTALSVRLEDSSAADRLEPLLVEAGAIDVEEEDDTSAEQAQIGNGNLTDSARASGEEVIPIVKEEMEVGKRVKEDRRIIRTHIIERPVEEHVNLRDETVVVERRPITAQQTAKPSDLQEREYEVIERREEPVAQKTARAVEEVVVKKDVRNRTETVKDKVRETEVEATKDPAATRD